MRQKKVSILSDIKSKTEWDEWAREAEMDVSCLRSHFCLEEYFKQVYQATHLVHPVDY